MESYLDRPVFVCGHRRSGTTLLINLLDSVNEAIVYPDDSGFFYMYYPLCETMDDTNEDKIYRLVNKVAIENLGSLIDKQKCTINEKEKLYKQQKKFIDKLKNFNKKQFTTRDILKYFIKSFGEVFLDGIKPKFWVEKTTSSEIYAIEMKKWFPDAKFIHVIRDPRDIWSSLMSGWDRRYSKYNTSKNNLMHSMIERGVLGFQMAIDNQITIGKSNYHVVRYEDLVDNPDNTMKNIANFMDIDFSKNLLTPSTFGINWRGNNFSGDKFNGISNNNSEKWKSRISEKDAMLIEYYFSSLMEEFGYKLQFDLDECQKQAIEHYKWYNFRD
jgi:hypothetical protein